MYMITGEVIYCLYYNQYKGRGGESGKWKVESGKVKVESGKVKGENGKVRGQVES